MRLKVLDAKQGGLADILTAAKEDLGNVSKGGDYKDTLQRLIVQGMHKLQEPTVVVRCRKEDLSIVEGQVDSARKTFKSTFNIEAPTITVDKKTFLAPGPVPGVDGVYCAGGVIVLSADGKIQCNNTLDHRLTIAYKQCLPHLRAMLFGEAEKVRAERTVQTIFRE